MDTLTTSPRAQLAVLARALIADSGLRRVTEELQDAEHSVGQARAVLARYATARRRRGEIISALTADGVPTALIAAEAGISPSAVGRIARRGSAREVRA